jgi:4-amino-4-deoxy-L-arabinose transferase-like glycosyltransferase
MTVQDRLRRHWPGLALFGLFVSTRLLARQGFHLPFDSNTFRYWQVLDIGLLRDDLARSLVYLHAQPPLYNLFLGLVLKLAGTRAPVAFDGAFLAMGYLTILGVYALVRELGAPRGAALAAAAVQTFSTTWLLYESWLFYTLPTAMLLTWTCVWLARAARGGPRAAWFVPLLVTAAAMLRSTYHLVWVVVALALLLTWVQGDGRQRRVAWTASILSVLLVGGLYGKNTRLVGSFGPSSWLGMSLARLTTDRLDEPTRTLWIRQGVLDPVAAVPAFSPLAAYPAARQGVPPGTPPHPALVARAKADGSPNFNHVAYVGIGRSFGRAAVQVIRRRPDIVRAGLGEALATWLKPPTEYELIEPRRPALAGWDRLHSRLLLWSASGPAGGGPCRVLFALAGLTALALLTRRGEDRRQILRMSALPLLTIGLNLVAGCLLESDENNRFRVEVEALIWALGSWSAIDLGRRTAAWAWRRGLAADAAKPQVAARSRRRSLAGLAAGGAASPADAP